MGAESMNHRELLRSLFQAAVDAADPAKLVPRHLPPKPRGRTIVVGAGKASAAMARALEQSWDGPLEGLVVTRYGHGVPCERIEIVEAAHPVPDAKGAGAAARMLELVKGLTSDDLVIALISGGASALLVAPADGLTLADKQAVTKQLLASGADITEMNCLRKHLSAIKGGRLAAAAAPARVVSLLISDVPGDDPGVIGSGPTVPDPTSFADARAILARYGLQLPPAVQAHMDRAADESPKPGDPRLARNEAVMIATPQLSLEAAAKVAKTAGIAPVILGDSIEGESREVARVMAGIVRAGEALWPAGGAALRPDLRRRDHGHRARQGPRRAQCGIPAGAGGGACAASTASTPWPAIPTASTGRRRSPAPSSIPPPGSGRGTGAWTPWRASPTMTATASSRPLMIS